MGTQKPYEITKDKLFSSWKELRDHIDNFEDHTRQLFNTGYSSTLQTSGKANIEGVNLDCEYAYVILHCKFGKPRHKSKNTRTNKLDCLGFIKATITEDLKHLKIHSFQLDHKGHDGSEEFYELFREKRRLKNEALKIKVAKLIKLKVSIASIQDKLSKEHGIEVIAKDIQNMKQRLKDKDGDKLSVAVSVLEKNDISNLSMSDSQEETDVSGLDSKIIMPTHVKFSGRPSSIYKSTIQTTKKKK